MIPSTFQKGKLSLGIITLLAQGPDQGQQRQTRALRQSGASGSWVMLRFTEARVEIPQAFATLLAPAPTHGLTQQALGKHWLPSYPECGPSLFLGYSVCLSQRAPGGQWMQAQ